ncbi:hypothetical protein BGW36DRAFT_317767 [Talaromyces proteolyticus]|uniref:Nuclear RNA binding protein n=1 Tax=Talaromyces proteolyticus TaxID=1131652 RepID=A0AAD4KTX7_9EURO|nr:uncharacterized protein BGW36DRAFT_317767 [Talaromyces proteolyticus]KAH8698379.1 hypothetical protein BGW36DRAFT_317767 [Talaromyces proteolyticus]
MIMQIPSSDSPQAPFINVEIEFDSLQTDPLVQQFNNNNNNDNKDDDNPRDQYDNEDNYSPFSINANALVHKRKLSSIIDVDVDIDGDSSDATSDTSGRFDDARESNMTMDINQNTDEEAAVQETRSVHSAKRGRSNGWPLQNEIAYDEHGMRIEMNSSRRTPTKAQSQSQSPRAKKMRSPELRARRSRFIEGSMHDRVSEKPPSIFFQDAVQKPAEKYGEEGDGHEKDGEGKLEKRSSGIFRFGKAIASAFHPFGAWGNKSDSDGSKAQKEIMKQRQARAEKAYAELKKSGYHGTTTTSTTGGSANTVDPSIADQTWKAIQEKMEYKIVAGQGRISQDDTLVAVPEALTPARQEKGISKLKSFSELRKRTSTLSIPAIRARDVSPMNLAMVEHDPNLAETPAIERRQSRKDLNRQAKLMKRVSNLEDKLERARRELRDISSTEPHLPVPTICVDDVHDSERQYAIGTLPTVPSGRLLDDSHHSDNEPSTSIWLPVDSLSRKRKPKADSFPDSSRQNEAEADISPKKTKPSKLDKPKTKLSTRDKRASSLTTKASQRLKAKQSSRNLRQSTPTSSSHDDSMCLQEQQGNNANASSRAVSPSPKVWASYNGDENIPPVPPVPKDLLNSAKLKKRALSKEFAWPEDIF